VRKARHQGRAVGQVGRMGRQVRRRCKALTGRRVGLVGRAQGGRDDHKDCEFPSRWLPPGRVGAYNAGGGYCLAGWARPWRAGPLTQRTP
jgi:hypothetical protein